MIKEFHELMAEIELEQFKHKLFLENINKKLED